MAASWRIAGLLLQEKDETISVPAPKPQLARNIAALDCSAFVMDL